MISGNEEAIAKTVGNGVINVIENGTLGVAGVKGVVHAGENAYQASQLHDSLWYGVGGALRVDELSERVTSERKTTLEAIWSFFSWIGKSIVSGVRAIVPFFGSTVDATNMSKVVYDAATEILMLILTEKIYKRLFMLMMRTLCKKQQNYWIKIKMDSWMS